MSDADFLDYRLLTGPELGAVVVTLRKQKGWTQETLAELSGVAARTVQRLEEGLPSSIDTRRAIAGALAFEDLDTFNKPWPIPNIEKLKAETERIERETIAVDVVAVTKGKQLRELAEETQSYLVTSIDDPPDEVEAVLAGLKDYYADYGDSHDLYSATDKLSINESFQGTIDELAALGFGLVTGRRNVRLRFDKAEPGDPGMPFTVGYVISGPAGAMPASIRVPRRGRFGL